MSDSSKSTVNFIGGALNLFAFIGSVVIGVKATKAQKAKYEKDIGDLAIFRAQQTVQKEMGHTASV